MVRLFRALPTKFSVQFEFGTAAEIRRFRRLGRNFRDLFQRLREGANSVGRGADSIGLRTGGSASSPGIGSHKVSYAKCLNLPETGPLAICQRDLRVEASRQTLIEQE